MRDSSGKEAPRRRGLRRWLLGLGLAGGFVVLAAGIGLAAARWAPADATMTLRAGETHQTIEGWEATARVWEYDKAADRFDGSWVAWREAILKTLVDQGGVSRLRLEIRSGAENPVDYWSQFQQGRIGYLGFKRHFYEKVNDNADPATLDPAGVQFSELDFRVENIVLPAQRIAQARGRRLAIVLCYVDFKWTEAKGTLSHARHPDEYAELIAATYAHLKAKYSLTPDALEIVLEPDNTDDWRGRRIGEAMVAVAARLKAAGVAAPMIAPSTAAGGLAPMYLDGLTEAPGAAALVSTVSYHRYDGPATDLALPGLVARARRLGARTAMLEYVQGGIGDLLRDLVNGDATAWQLYGVAAKAPPPKGKPSGVMVSTVFDATGRPTFGLSDQGRDLAQVFAFVEPGAVRLGASAWSGGKAWVAFRNPDGGVVTVIHAERAGEVRLRGLPVGRYALRVSGEDRSPVVVATEEMRLRLRKGQVATLYPARDA